MPALTGENVAEAVAEVEDAVARLAPLHAAHVSQVFGTTGPWWRVSVSIGGRSSAALGDG